MRVKKLMQAGYFRQRPIVFGRDEKRWTLSHAPAWEGEEGGDVVGLSHRHLSQSLDWFSLLRED